MQAYIDKRFIDESEPAISLNDRSFRFGDGVFETALVCNGKVFGWEFHAERLARGLKHYGLEVDISLVPSVTAELIKRNAIKEGYIRVVISRGVSDLGGVGYKLMGDEKHYMVIQTVSKPLPEYQSIPLLVASLRAFYHMPSKSNNCMLYTMSLIEADKAGCGNALILSPEGYICETATANIFWVKDGVLYTPSTDLPFVAGTMRRRIFKLWQGEVREGKFTVEDLSGAEEIFMSNVGGIITSISEVKPHGIKTKSGAKALELRNKIVAEITGT